jgi:proline iminopeptidase
MQLNESCHLKLTKASIRTQKNPRRRPSLILWLAVFLVARISYADDGSFVRDSVQLHYRTSGSGAPVIFLSGGPGFDVDYMIPVAEFVPTDFQRVFYEQRGTGRSLIANMTAEHMTLRHVVDDLEALRVHLKQDQLFLIGHSWGGMLAMAYAATYPMRVDRLILIGSGGPTLEFAGWFQDNIRMRLRPEDLEAERYWDEAPKRGVDPDKAALEGIRAISPGYFFDRAKGLAFASQMPDGALHVHVNTLLFSDMRKTSYDLGTGLRLVDRPVLIVQGHQDPVGDKTAEDIHALIKSSALKYINQSGHFPWIEQPEEFGRIMAEFFASARTK